MGFFTVIVCSTNSEFFRLESDDEGVPSTAIREISLLKELQHANIVSLQDVIMEETRYERFCCSDKKSCWNAVALFCLTRLFRLYLVFEFLDMDLRKYLDKLPEGKYMHKELLKSYMYQISQAILFCHTRRVLHRDLKPQNLLITKDGTIKVCN